RLFNMLDSSAQSALRGHEDEVTGVAFGLENQRLASGSRDHTIRLWDMATRQTVMVIKHGDWVRRLVASPDGNLLASACKDGTVKVISFATGEVIRTINAHEGGVDCVAFNHDGSLLATGGRDNAIKLWNLHPSTDGYPMSEPVAVLARHTRPVLTLAF